jgi:hypothetical protein
MPKATAPETAPSRRPATNEKRVAKRLTSGSTHSCCCLLQLLTNSSAGSRGFSGAIAGHQTEAESLGTLL